jgi:murein L,D-transpeptidase YafK
MIHPGEMNSRVCAVSFSIACALFTVLLLLPYRPAAGAEAEASPVRADYILVEKAEKRLTLFNDNIPLKSYAVALGRNPVGPKLKEGDQRTPEGRYRIDSRNAESKYHLALHISYPNEIDRQITSIAGVSPGNNIMIHGTGDEYSWMGEFHSVLDWTDGCIAVTNEEIEELWELVPDGTVIDIVP